MNGNNSGEDFDMEKALTDQAVEDLLKLGEEGNAISSPGGKLGVLQRGITSELDEKHYRQSLLLAAFDDKQEALLCADAITERLRYGVSIEPILARVDAACGVKSSRIRDAFMALSHRTVSTYTGGKDKKEGYERPRQ